MVLRFSKLYLTFIVLCGLLMLGSCSRSDVLPDDPYEPQPWDDSPIVMLHIASLSSGNAQMTTVREKIRSLRIIMMHEDGAGNKYIEANRLIDTKTANAEDFSYIFQKRTIVGQKSFYLIANEESVTSVKFVDGVRGNGYAGNNLTAFLNHFKPNMPTDKDDMDDAGGGAVGGDGGDGGGSGTAGEEDGDDTSDDDDDDDNKGGSDTTPQPSSAVQFETLLNSLYLEFDPKTQSIYPNESAGSEKNIYLPYSAYYTGDEYYISGDKHEVDKTSTPMYLVPVATKFTFTFINERTSDVAVDYLTLVNTNKANYLMAKLDESELTKRILGDANDYYWIDWLKIVTGDTKFDQTTDDNTAANTKYGWIRYYRLPKYDYSLVDGFVTEANPTDDDVLEYDFVAGTALDGSFWGDTDKLPTTPAPDDGDDDDKDDPDNNGQTDTGDSGNTGEEEKPGSNIYPKNENAWILKRGTDENNSGNVKPSEKTIGPFYLPEGHNFVKEEPETPNDNKGGTDTPATGESTESDTSGAEDGNKGDDSKGDTADTPATTTDKCVDRFYIKIQMRDTDGSIVKRYAKTEFSNLKALFRNTHVHVTITLREGGVKIYAEPVDWELKLFYGYVQDEDSIK